MGMNIQEPDGLLGMTGYHISPHCNTRRESSPQPPALSPAHQPWEFQKRDVNHQVKFVA